MYRQRRYRHQDVASRADAWIETRSGYSREPRPRVASRADAWIETRCASACSRSRTSRPARTRGLKHYQEDVYINVCLSRPARTRGLKLGELGRISGVCWSRPARTRGLKPKHLKTRHFPKKVASRADAWIETATVAMSLSLQAVASRADAWIETETAAG